jgi:hypothetical protein
MNYTAHPWGSGDERWLPSFADIIILLDAVFDDAPGAMYV